MVKNTVKTFTLLAALGGFLVLVGSLIGGTTGTLIGLGLGLAIVGSSFWFSDAMAVRAARAQPVDPTQLTWLQADLEELASRAGMRHTPRLYLSPDPSRTPSRPAAASGAVVCVTAGLLDQLDRDEVRGVVAHEVAHVRHRDILIGSVAAAVATGISALANMAMFAGLFGGGGDDDDRPSPFTLLLLSLVAPIAASVMQLALSRSREYEADRLGAELVGDPRPLASALRKIEVLARRTPMDVSPAQATAYIVNPLTGRQVSFARLFLTHPPTEDRIARLMGTTVEPAR